MKKRMLNMIQGSAASAFSFVIIGNFTWKFWLLCFLWLVIICTIEQILKEN